MNDFDESGAPMLSAHDRVRLVVMSLSNWTYEERIEVLASRGLACRRNMTKREGRTLRREYATWLASVVAHFNPMILDGTFAQLEQDYNDRRGCSGAPIDRIISLVNYGLAYDNRGNRKPLCVPEIFRTKHPWACPLRSELVPHAWEGMVVCRG